MPQFIIINVNCIGAFLSLEHPQDHATPKFQPSQDRSRQRRAFQQAADKIDRELTPALALLLGQDHQEIQGKKHQQDLYLQTEA